MVFVGISDRAVGKAAISPTGEAHNLTGVVATVGEALLYIGFMVTAGRWFLKKLSTTITARDGYLSWFWRGFTWVWWHRY